MDHHKAIWGLLDRGPHINQDDAFCVVRMMGLNIGWHVRIYGSIQAQLRGSLMPSEGVHSCQVAHVIKDKACSHTLIFRFLCSFMTSMGGQTALRPSLGAKAVSPTC